MECSITLIPVPCLVFSKSLFSKETINTNSRPSLHPCAELVCILWFH
jgi:hypothetical protein